MGLVAWYPLKDDINDYSLNNYHLTNTNPASVVQDVTEGKLGKCYNFSGSGGLRNNGDAWKTFNSNEFTIAVWMKPTTINNPYNGSIGIQNDTGASLTATQMSLALFNPDKLALQYNNNGAWAYVNSGIAVPANVWTHTAITVKGDVVSFYINGVNVNTITVAGLQTIMVKPNENSFLSIGVDFPGGDECYIGKYNDVRIYDEVLTQKQIREIYKTCILHYSFNDPYSEPTENVYGGKTVATNKEMNGYNGWSLTAPTTSSVRAVIFSGSVPIEPDTFYTASCIYYSSNNALHSLYIKFNDVGWVESDYYIKPFTVQTVLKSGNYSIIDLGNGWKKCIGTFRTQATTTASVQVIFDVNANNAGVEVFVAEFQLEKGDHNTPYTDGIRDDGVSDSSGFNNIGINNLTITPTWVEDSITGRGCFKFTAISYIKTPMSNFIKEGTVSLWVKVGASTGTQQSILSVSYDSSNYPFWIYRQAGTLYVAVFSTAYSTNRIDGFFIQDEWTMITVTFSKGGNCKIYKNGALALEFTADSVDANVDTKLFIGELRAGRGLYLVDGYIDDVRIYGTILSNSDIKQLYESRYTLDVNGDFYCEELIENPLMTGNIKFNEKGILEARVIDELNIYGMDYKQLDDGSQWAKIFHHYNRGGTVLFASNAEALDIQTADKYSKLNLLEKFRAVDGKFELLLEYPNDLIGYNRWKQTSNPVVTTTPNAGVTGYEPISITWTVNGWGGLEYNGTDTLCDGQVNHEYRYYAIGSQFIWNNSIPGPDVTVSYVELWVRIDTVNINSNVFKFSKDDVVMAHSINEK